MDPFGEAKRCIYMNVNNINNSKGSGLNMMRDLLSIFGICRMHRDARAIILIGAALMVGGCSGTLGELFQPAGLFGAPDRSIDVDEDIESLVQYAGGDVVAGYEQAGADPQARREYRNRVVTARLRLIDLNYQNFIELLHAQRSTRNVVLDTVGLGLTAAASVVGGQAAIQALSATATGIGGVNATLDSEVYYDHTLPIMITQMEAERARVRERILDGLQKNDGDYPLFLAMSDLDQYYRAGSIFGAIIGLSRDSGAKLEENTEGEALALDATSMALRRRLVGLAEELTPERALAIAQDLPSQGQSDEQFLIIANTTPNYQEDGAAAQRLILLVLGTQIFTEADLLKWEEALSSD